MTALTIRQEALLRKPLQHAGPHPFIVLDSPGEDRIAQNLQTKGWGCFVDNGMHYPWRSRSGYTNTFYVYEKGLRHIKATSGS